MAVHEKSIVVNAPVDEVFTMWRNFENFPQFMSHVKEVKVLEGDMSHWKGRIDGFDEEWDAKTTKLEENKTIAWDSTAGFENSGEIRFESADGGTRVTVHIEYTPPAGVLGRAAEAIYVGRSFEESMEEDLQRFKERAEGKLAA